MDGAVDPGLSGERLRRLQSLQDRHSRERLAALTGKEVEILLEGESTRGDGRMCGRTPCHKMVNFVPAGGNGPLRNVLVTSAGAHSLVGEERG